MKPQETMQNIPPKIQEEIFDEIGDSHYSTSIETPMIEGAFDIHDSQKKKSNCIPLFRDHENYGIRFKGRKYLMK